MGTRKQGRALMIEQVVQYNFKGNLLLWRVFDKILPSQRLHSMEERLFCKIPIAAQHRIFCRQALLLLLLMPGSLNLKITVVVYKVIIGIDFTLKCILL